MFALLWTLHHAVVCLGQVHTSNLSGATAFDSMANGWFCSEVSKAGGCLRIADLVTRAHSKMMSR